MSLAPHGGLSGKARHLRCRSRAQRLVAKQLIDDFNELQVDAEVPERYIRISGRNEFLPAIAQASLRTPRPAYAQLELPLRMAGDDTAWASTRESSTDPRTFAATGSTPGAPTDAPAASKMPADLLKEQVIRFARSAGPDVILPFKPPEQLDRPKAPPFTIGGFLAGCAMGSAAAAVALLVVRTILG